MPADYWIRRNEILVNYSRLSNSKFPALQDGLMQNGRDLKEGIAPGTPL
jgi:hypothetical protein